MSPLKKILVAVIALTVLAVIGGAAFILLPKKNRLFIEMGSRTKELKHQVDNAINGKQCLHSPEKNSCFKNFIIQNKSVLYASDINLYSQMALAACERRVNSYCVIQLTNELITMIDIDKYGILQNGAKDNPDHSKLKKSEFNVTERFLRRQRNQMVTFYKAESKAEIKQNVLKFLATTDQKIIELQTANKNSF